MAAVGRLESPATALRVGLNGEAGLELKSSHEVTGLCRSQIAAEKLQNLGATPLYGDLRAPDVWAEAIGHHDGIIHAAATFSTDMGQVDRGVVDALEHAALRAGHRPRFLYTGGCWLYGETGDEVAVEGRPFRPLPAFAWMVENGTRILASSAFSAALIHPAMVYHTEGGAFARFLGKARENQPVEIWGSPDIRWPIIHHSDLAKAYRHLLECGDVTGHFNASAQKGVRVGDIASFFAGDAGVSVIPAAEVRTTHGESACGPMLDQQMSAGKLRRICGWTPRHADFRTTDFTLSCAQSGERS